MLMGLRLAPDDPLADALRVLKERVGGKAPAAALPAEQAAQAGTRIGGAEGNLLYAFDRAAEYSFQAAYPLKATLEGAFCATSRGGLRTR